MKPAVSVDLSDFPLHCPKCGMQFARTRDGIPGPAPERLRCSDCGVAFGSGSDAGTQNAQSYIGSVDEARRCWGLA